MKTVKVFPLKSFDNGIGQEVKVDDEYKSDDKMMVTLDTKRQKIGIIV